MFFSNLLDEGSAHVHALYKLREASTTLLAVLLKDVLEFYIFICRLFLQFAKR
jgi:hypothetical protein